MNEQTESTGPKSTTDSGGQKHNVVMNTKWLLIIPMTIFEIIFLAVCWIVAIAHKPTGESLVEWSIKILPGKEWYS